MSQGSRLRKPDAVGKAVFAAVVTWLSLLLIVPIAALAWVVITHATEVFEALTASVAVDALLRSVGVAVTVVVINGVAGVVGGLLIVRGRFPGRRLLDAMVDLPFALSPVMTGLAFLLLFGRGGLAAPLLDAVGLQVAFAWPAVLLATLFVTLPFVLREVVLVLDELGDTEEQAASTLGASPWQTFWRVTFPNLREALAVGATLTLARALGEFGAVLVVGGAIAHRTMTATTFLHGAIEERQEPAAFGMALLLAALAVALLAVLEQPHRS